MFKEIAPQKVQEMLEEGAVNVVDIRDPGSYSAGHIPTAVSLSDSNAQEFIASADKEKPLWSVATTAFPAKVPPNIFLKMDSKKSIA